MTAIPAPNAYAALVTELNNSMTEDWKLDAATPGYSVAAHRRIGEGVTGLWLHLLEAHHFGALTTEQLHRCLAVSEQNVAYEIIGRHVDLNSTKQLQVVLYDELALDPVIEGEHATDTDTLTELRHRTGHPFLERLLGYRLATL